MTSEVSEEEIRANEELYRRATWRMYHRITTARTAQGSSSSGSRSGDSNGSNGSHDSKGGVAIGGCSKEGVEGRDVTDACCSHESCTDECVGFDIDGSNEDNGVGAASAGGSGNCGNKSTVVPRGCGADNNNNNNNKNNDNDNDKDKDNDNKVNNNDNESHSRCSRNNDNSRYESTTNGGGNSSHLQQRREQQRPEQPAEVARFTAMNTQQEVNFLAKVRAANGKGALGNELYRGNHEGLQKQHPYQGDDLGLSQVCSKGVVNACSGVNKAILNHGKPGGVHRKSNGSSGQLGQLGRVLSEVELFPLDASFKDV